MRNNLMQFGDTYFLQLIGTAMGTSVAVVFANLYYSWHERNCILPHYNTKENPTCLLPKLYLWHLLHMGRYRPTMWQACKDTNKFGIVRWDFNKPTNTITFLDLAVTIKNGNITTKTIKKKNPLRLHHTIISSPTWYEKRVIFGMVRHYYDQNSDQKDSFTSLS